MATRRCRWWARKRRKQDSESLGAISAVLFIAPLLFRYHARRACGGDRPMAADHRAALQLGYTNEHRHYTMLPLLKPAYELAG
jgi:hypothetical protein